MQKDEELLKKRLQELSSQAYYRGIVTYSDFMNLNELNILHSIPYSDLYTRFETFGGYELSERQMAAFIPDALYCEINYLLIPVKIAPLNKKFTEELTHRDFLGAILNLGINRNKIGDILVGTHAPKGESVGSLQEQEAILFLQESLLDFLQKELTRVKHTQVSVEIADFSPENYHPAFEEITGTVASIRLDSLLALAFPVSRSKMTSVIEAARVFVNGKLITNNGYQVREGDIISVRKMGKFRYIKTLTKTKKNRYMILLHKYI